MFNKLLLLLTGIISIASIMYAIQTRKELITYVNRPAGSVASSNKTELEGAQRQLRALETKLANLASRLDGLESRPAAAPTVISTPNSSSLDAVDANIETLLRTTTQNTQDVQTASKQIRDLAQQCQVAFNAAAADIQKLRSEVKTLSEKLGR